MVGSVFYDLFAARNVVLEPGSTRLVETDFSFCFFNKYVAKIYNRSNVFLKSVLVGGGIIDPGFRGNVRATLHSFSANRVKFNKGYRIAQMLFQEKEPPSLIEVEIFDNFVTERNTKGFGSTRV